MMALQDLRPLAVFRVLHAQGLHCRTNRRRANEGEEALIKACFDRASKLSHLVAGENSHTHLGVRLAVVAYHRGRGESLEAERICRDVLERIPGEFAELRAEALTQLALCNYLTGYRVLRN